MGEEKSIRGNKNGVLAALQTCLGSAVRILEPRIIGEAPVGCGQGIKQ
jgi:hypothetical protein